MAETPADDLPTRLAALRASGADRRDPVGFVTFEALARRAVSQPESIRRPLLAKLSALADQLAASPAPAAPAIEQTATVSPLAELLSHISRHAHAQPGAAQLASETARPGRDFRPAAVNREFRQNSQAATAGRSRPGPELKAVAYFRNEWSKLSTEQQLTQTLAQAPANAGPMNSQHLVLRSLQLMRDVAPDYLQGFMSYIDTLIWLDQTDPTRSPAGRTAPGEGEKKPRTAKRSAPKR